LEGTSRPVETLADTHGLVTRAGTRIWASSERLGWRSLFASVQREAPFEAYFRPVADHLIVMPLSGPVRVARALDGRCESRLVAPGGAFIMPADTEFGLRLAAPLDTVHFYLHRAIVDEIAQEFARSTRGVGIIPRLGEADPLLEQIAIALREQLREASETSTLYVDHLARTAAARLLKGHSTAALKPAPPGGRAGLTGARLRRAIDYIEANLHDDVALAELAAVAGLSPVYFARQFKLAVGLAPHQYLLKARVSRAKRLLAMGELSIAAVAFDCGFCHQEHLTRVFRRHCGMTPGTYRATVRG
jgi:AraC family transcriptional regulator